MAIIAESVEGCTTCQGTGGAYSCPTHSPYGQLPEESTPFVQLWVRCPHCLNDLRFDGYKESRPLKLPSVRKVRE